jgi:crotonobetainyl-CoA:carnitine CoA-transferase CaiB-like acyl-CoA transferase
MVDNGTPSEMKLTVVQEAKMSDQVNSDSSAIGRQRALEGIRVLDITQFMAGPFCTMVLADLGADVIKIEPPAGESTRRMVGAVGTESPAFNAVNRGKRSLVLDLKSSAGQHALTRLARSTDIVVENYRPGVMRSLGLDYQPLAAVNPGLIYASISGYGQTGPDRAKGGFDLIAQGVTGIMSITGEPGGAPVKAGIPVTDLGAALFALTGILAALEYRHRTGRGQCVDTSLVEAGVALSVWEATEYFSGLGTPEPMGSAHRMNAPYQAVRCADGYITIGANTDRLFQRLCEALDHNEWVADSGFADNASRVRNRARLAALIETVTVGHPRRRWLELLEAREIPCGPINDYSQVFADSQIRARDMVGETDHPVLGHLRTLGSPIKLSRTPPDATRRAPLLGEHTREVLDEFGFNDDEISKLVYHGEHGGHGSG